MRKDANPSKPLVSVCLITYKHELYIRQAIDGVLKQVVDFEWEFIIADDNSPDETRAILFDYKARYPTINLILQKINVGPGNNFNDLLSTAVGKYIAYLEGDDYWTDPLKLQKQVNFLESNQDYGLVCTNAKFYVDQTARMVNQRPPYKRDSDITFHELLKGNPVISLTTMFRADAYKKIAYILNIAVEEGWKMGDYPLWLELSQSYRVRYLYFESGVYRILQNSATNRDDKSKLMAFEKSAFEVRRYFIRRYRKEDDRLLKDIELDYQIMRLRFSILSNETGKTIHIFGEIFKLGLPTLFRKLSPKSLKDPNN